jgi:hypothetical protein
MGLREDVIRVLNSRETHRIAFSFTATNSIAAVTVNSRSFHRVLHGIQTGHVHFQPGGMPAGAARYRISTNRLNMGRMNRESRLYDALIVHEMVHASLDLSHSMLPHVDSEAAAYIAQGFFLRTSGFDQNRLPQGGDAQEILLGFLIAEHIQHSNTIPAASLNELRDSLLHNSHYQSIIHGMFVGNG